MERNALVFISNQRGQEFMFAEVEKGIYKSIDKFGAQKGDSYILRIQTQDGDKYTSDPMMLSAQVTTSGLSVSASVNNTGDKGASLQWYSTTENSSGSYYRFTYEETYKIIAPMWSPYDAVVVSEGVDTFDLRVVLREQEEKIYDKHDKFLGIKLVRGAYWNSEKNEGHLFLNKYQTDFNYNQGIYEIFKNIIANFNIISSVSFCRH